MNRIRVVSSNIASIGYDPIDLLLEVEFNSGWIYHYFNVPLSVYHGLMAAGSHGQFFHANIRDRYAYLRIA